MTETETPRKPKSSPLWGRAEFTSGQCARIAGVAARTVAKWFDSGLLKGYRIPGSKDRRVPRANLVQFMREHGMLHRLQASGFSLDPVAVGVECAVPGELPEGWTSRRCDYATGLLAAATEASVAMVVVSGSVGRAMASEFAAAVRNARPSSPPRLVFASAADYWDAETPAGFDAAVTEPIDPAALWALVAPTGGV